MNLLKTQCIVSAAIAVAIAASCSGCGSSPSWRDEMKSMNTVPVHADGKTAFVDNKGKITEIPAGIDKVGFLINGLAVARDSTNNLYGYIDEKGSWRIQPVYKSASDFSEGMAWVAQPDSSLRLIDTSGKELLALAADIISISTINDGLAKYSDIEEREGIIDTKGNIMLGGKTFRAIGNYDDKYAMARLDNDRFSSVDIATGEEWMNGKFNNARPSADGKYMIVSNDGEKWGLVSAKNGEYLINPHYKSLFSDGDIFIFQDDKGKYGWCDSNGKTVIPAKYDQVYPFDGNRYAIVKLNDKAAVIDKNGERVIKAKYKYINSCYGDYFFINDEGLWGIADTKGNICAEPQFKMYNIYGNVIIATTDMAKWGVINTDGLYQGDADLSPDANMYIRAKSDNFNPSVVAKLIEITADRLQTTAGTATLGNLMSEYKIFENNLSPYPGESVELRAAAIPGDIAVSVSAIFDEPAVKSVKSGYYRYRKEVQKELKPSYYTIYISAPDSKFLLDVSEILVKNGKIKAGTEISGDPYALNIVIEQSGTTLNLFNENLEDSGFTEDDM